MGRRHTSTVKKKRPTFVCETEEREKIKENILKVFRAHLATPNQGGALLVGPDKKKDKDEVKENKKCHKSEKRSHHSQEQDESSSDSMSGGERGKRKIVSRRRRQTKTSSSKNKQVEKPSAVSKHMKVAHGVTYSHPGQDDMLGNKVNMISRSRLTQKVGLVNTGKKSAAVTRGVLMVPEYINKQTDAAIHKIVEDTDADVQHTTDLDVMENLVLSKSSSIKSQTPGSVDMKSRNTTCDSIRSVQSEPSPVHSEGFPQKLAIRETVRQLLLPLREMTVKVYPGADLLKETKNDLMKLLKQNAPKVITPTPIPVLNKITRAGSLQRSLIESYHPRSTEKHKQYVPESHANFHKANNPTDRQHSRGFSFEACNTSVPSLDFSGGVNPFQDKHSRDADTRHHSKHDVSNERDVKKTKNDLNFYRERDFKEDNQNVFYVKKPNHSANLHLLHDSAKLLEYNRDQIRSEISRSLNSDDKDDRNRIRNDISRSLNSDYKDDLKQRKPVHDNRKVSDYNNFFCKSHDHYDNDSYFIVEKHNTTPIPPILQSSSIIPTPVSPILSSEAKALLEVNEQNNVKQSIEVFEPMEVETSRNEAVNLLQKNDILMGIAEHGRQDTYRDFGLFSRSDLDRKDGKDGEGRSNSQCSHCSQCSNHSNHDHIQPHKSHTTNHQADYMSNYHQGHTECQGRRQAEYMPSFHGNYYADHTRDVAWQHKGHQSKIESMDILDYVDRDSHMDCRGDRTAFQHTTASDSDGSPPWKTRDPVLKFKSLLPPPPDKSPDPKMYPRKMY